MVRTSILPSESWLNYQYVISRGRASRISRLALGHESTIRNDNTISSRSRPGVYGCHWCTTMSESKHQYIAAHRRWGLLAQSSPWGFVFFEASTLIIDVQFVPTNQRECSPPPFSNDAILSAISVLDSDLIPLWMFADMAWELYRTFSEPMD